MLEVRSLKDSLPSTRPVSKHWTKHWKWHWMFWMIYFSLQERYWGATCLHPSFQFGLEVFYVENLLFRRNCCRYIDQRWKKVFSAKSLCGHVITNFNTHVCNLAWCDLRSAHRSERDRRCQANVLPESQTGTSERGLCGGDERSEGKNKKRASTVRLVTGRWKHTHKDRYTERCWESLVKTHREKMGPRRVGHRDSDLYLMSLAVDQQKECIITDTWIMQVGFF